MEIYSGSIYLIVNLVNNKKYVGQTIQPIERRFKSHFYKGDSPKLYNALKKYGKSKFKLITLKCIVTTDFDILAKKLDESEIFYIQYYDSINNGYNISLGGQRKRKMSDEIKKKISEAQKGEKGNMWGKHHPESVKRKISEGVSRTRLQKFNKPVLQYDLDGNFIQEFNSIKEAAKSFGSKRSHIADCCNNVRHSCFGYKWQWK